MRRPTASMFPGVASQEEIDRESRFISQKKHVNSAGKPFLIVPAVAFMPIALVLLANWLS